MSQQGCCQCSRTHNPFWKTSLDCPRPHEVGCLVALSICKFCCLVCDVHVAICQGDFQDAVTDDTIDLVFTAQTESTNYDSDTYDFVVVEKDYV